MSFTDDVKNEAERFEAQVPQFEDKRQTEATTIIAFVTPFIRMLGYDTSNASEVLAETSPDEAAGRNEKIDLAIFKDDQPLMVIECKRYGEDVLIDDNPHYQQLLKYYQHSKAKIGILTNGIEYAFYTDSEAPGHLDREPFFIFNVLRYSESDVNNLRTFTKSEYTEESVQNLAMRQTYLEGLTRAIKALLYEAPDEAWMRHLIWRLQQTGTIKRQRIFLTTLNTFYKPIIEKALDDVIDDIRNSE